MARYDRIAALPLPAAETAFSGWPALRELAGRERDAELGRRLRAHFVTLRPLHRYAAVRTATPDSIAAQADRARADLLQLPARDPQRIALAALLDALGEGSVAAIVQRSLDVADRASRWEHHAAAAEYALAALVIARGHELGSAELATLRTLARVSTTGGQAQDGEAYARRAAALALQLGDHEAWAAAMVELGSAVALTGGQSAGIAVLGEVQLRARDWSVPAVGAIAEAALCRHLLEAGDCEAALDHGWRALRETSQRDARRALTAQLAEALNRLGMRAAAEHCLDLLERHAPTAGERLEARAGRAFLYAESGDAASFHATAAALGEQSPPLPAAAWLALARGAFLADAPGDARRYAQAAITAARTELEPRSARAAQELLTALDRGATGLLAVQTARAAGGALAAGIGDAILSMGDTLLAGPG